MDEVYEFLKKAGTYYLATVDGDKARCRPFGTIDIFDGALYIQTGAVKDVSKQMKANPNVEICACIGPEWIRLNGKAVLDERIEAAQHMLDNYPMLAERYQPGDGNCEVFRLEECTAKIESFVAEPKEFKF